MSLKCRKMFHLPKKPFSNKRHFFSDLFCSLFSHQFISQKECDILKDKKGSCINKVTNDMFFSALFDFIILPKECPAVKNGRHSPMSGMCWFSVQKSSFKFELFLGDKTVCTECTYTVNINKQVHETEILRFFLLQLSFV